MVELKDTSCLSGNKRKMKLYLWALEKTIPVKNKIAPERHLKIEPFRKEIRITRPHKHKQYFEIVFLSQGSGVHWIDGIGYEVKGPVIFFINRDQTHYWELHGEPEGYVLILKSSFLQHSGDGALKQLLHRVWHANCLYLEDEGYLNTLFGLLVGHARKFSVNDQYAIDGLLKALIAGILERNGGSIRQTGLPSQLYIQFIELLTGRQDLQRSVGYFARELHVTTQTLNLACRKSANRSAGKIRDDFIINEAQRLLLYTDGHVNEVAQLLNFKDASYFIKFFKRHRKATPEEFRKSHFQR